MARYRRRRAKGKNGWGGKGSILLALLLLALALGWQQYRPTRTLEGHLEIHMIDVGQGDSILLRSGDETMLVDTGLTGTGDDVVAYLRAQGIRKLDRLLISHDHNDHSGGLSRVLKDIDTEVLMLYDGGDRDSGYLLAGELAGSSSCDIAFVEQGQQFPLGEAIVKVVFPKAGYDSDDLNDESVVLLVEGGGRTALLTGDSTAAAELLYYEDLPAIDVLKVAHHGSGGSSSTELLQAIRPKIALISCGLNNDYGHPHDRVMDDLTDLESKLYRTDRQGDLVVTVKDGELSVKTER